MILQRISQFFVLLLILIGASWYAQPAHAAEGDVYGWAWSSNIGWIGFSCEQTFSCITTNAVPGVDFGVKMSTTTGELSGYAWSPSVGWLSFNSAEVSGCPSGSCAPTVNLTTGGVSGFMKSIQTDSWISLSGTNHTSPDTSGNSGVTFATSTGKFNGFAWSSEFGWINFRGTTDVGVGTTPVVTDTPVTAPVCQDFFASPSTAMANEDIEIIWSATDVEGDISGVTTSYTLTQNGFDVSGFNTSRQPNGTYNFGPIDQNMAFNLMITNTSISDPSKKATSTCIPTDVVFQSSPDTNKFNLIIGRTTTAVNGVSDIYTSGNKSLRINRGRPFALRWGISMPNTPLVCTQTVRNGSGGTDSTTATWESGWASFFGKNPVSGVGSFTSSATTPLGSYTFTYSCTDSSTPTPVTKTSSSVLTVTNSTIREQ